MLDNLDVDLLFTGELSHHEALAAVEQGRCVVTAFHSNTERGFLREVMKPKLEAELNKVIENMEEDVMEDQGQDEVRFEVAVSEVDRDPFEVVVPGTGAW